MEVQSRLAGTEVQRNRKISPPSLEPLEGMVICPIDLNLLEDPRLLPCGHAFCCECLTNYIRRIPSPQNGSKEPGMGEELTLTCPICRTACTMPQSKSGSSFPKAFNHLVILDFLRKNQLSAFKMSSNNNQVPTAPLDGNGLKSRKTSIQVSSQMLNYIVSDIASRERDGKIGPTDRAVILDEVTALLEKLNGQGVANNSSNHKQETTGKRSVSSTSSTNSPSGSYRNVDRFNAFASKAQGVRRISRTTEIQPDTPSYTTYRDAESVRLTMKSNAIYTVISKGKDCCIMRLGDLYQPVDLKLIPMPNSNQLLRQTVTTDEERLKLTMWCQTVGRSGNVFPVSNRSKRPVSQNFVEYSGPVRLEGRGTLKVQYLRYFHNRLYVSGIVLNKRTDSNSIYPNLSECERSEQMEYGLIVRCQTPTLENGNETEARGNDNPFPVESISCPFWRDSVGSQRTDQPVIFGFDIDQSNGDVYVAQPANAMISRLHQADMTQVDGTWYLNEPQLSPYFVCFAETSRQIWATCPREEKIAILDLETDGFHHFNPTVSFGISPTHIVYTSDDRIVMLDQSQSKMFWITKIHHTICVQCLDVQFSSRLKRQLIAIQPMDDTVTNILFKSDKCRPPAGGMLCAHNYGCSIIYPIGHSRKSRFPNLICSSLCGQ